MSGPKSYTVPRQYSRVVLEGRLAELFASQLRLTEVARQLGICVVVTPDGNTHDGRQLLQEVGKQVAEASAAQLASAAVSSGAWADAARAISQAQQQVGALEKRLRARVNELEATREDVAAHQRLGDFAKHKHAEANAFCQQIDAYVASHPNAVARDSSFELQLPSFDFGHGARNNESQRRQQLANALDGFKESTRQAVFGAPAKGRARENSEDERLVDAVTAVKALLVSTKQESLSGRFSERLGELLKGSRPTSYSVNELHDELLRESQQLELRERVLAELEANKAVVELGLLSRTAHQLLASPKLTASAVEAWRREVDVEANRAQAERALRDLEAREQAYLREQLVHGLESLGYQAVDRTVVLDFAQDDVFLTTAHAGQFVNLQFLPSGEVIYRYLTAQPPEALTPQEAGSARHNMESACTDFKTVLRDLAQAGLELTLGRALPASPENLIQAPEHVASLPVKKTNHHIHGKLEKTR